MYVDSLWFGILAGDILRDPVKWLPPSIYKYNNSNVDQLVRLGAPTAIPWLR